MGTWGQGVNSNPRTAPSHEGGPRYSALTEAEFPTALLYVQKLSGP